jgi:RNA polymerase sigma-70 factor (ECF subfamily)
MAIAARDEAALEAVYERHGGAVYGLALRITKNATLAEDVTQEVLVRLWRNPEKFDARRGSLRTYLMTQTHGRSVDLIRSESSRRMREDNEARLAGDLRHPAVDEAVIDMQVAEEVRSALAQLEPSQRKAIELAYYGGHSYREVAEMLSQPEGTVKSRIRAGMRCLHEHLAPMAP